MHLSGQYFAAFPGHAADLERPLEEPLLLRWTERARLWGVNLPTLVGVPTRGAFIRAAFVSARKVRPVSR